MDWASIRTGLPVILSSITGLPTSAITWRKSTSGWKADRHIHLQVLGGVRAQGVDERRYRYVSGSDQNRERVYGGRVISISIRVETQDQDLEDSAAALAEEIRIRLRRTSVQARLRDEACLGVSDMDPIRIEDYPDAHDRLRSLAILDVRFLAHVSDEEALDIGYFETVNAEDSVTDPAGDPVPLELDTAWDLT